MKMRSSLHRWFAVHRAALALGLCACGGGEFTEEGAPDPGTGTAGQSGNAGGNAGNTDSGAGAVLSDEAYFRDDHVLDVSIEMTPADWDALRFEGRDLSALTGDCVAGPPPDIYNLYPASITVEGQRVDDVGVRKKGFLGSLTLVRPSLKVDFDAFVAGQALSGMKRMTFNNNKQDAALIRQCLVYYTFARAGVPAPRCNFARVEVNGVDLGVYSHVEEVKKPFLRRHFAADSGNLYEGQRSDFSTALVATFEAKTNELTNDRSDLQAVVTALANDSLAEVEALVDLDTFYTFWALEVLTAHWDGYASNRNNFYLYGDPSSAKFQFLPWGPDMAFTTTDPFHPIRPASVSAQGLLTEKLYTWPESKAAYLQRVQEVLDAAWDETALLAEVDRLAALLGTADASGLTEIRDYIESRRGAIELEIALGGGSWSNEEETSYCFDEVGSVSGSFVTDWNSLDAEMQHTYGSGTLAVTLQGMEQSFAAVGAVAGPDGTSQTPAVRVVGANLANAAAPHMLIEQGMWQPGTTVPFHGFANYGILFTLDGLTLAAGGFIAAGSVTLDEAATSAGQPVTGSFTGKVYWRQ